MPGRFWRRRSGSMGCLVCCVRTTGPFGSVGAGGLSPFAVKVVKAGVLPERIDPGQPQQNGRLERLHGTVVLETTSPAASKGRRFAIFRRDYNEERPHEALGQTPPADHYECSPRRYSGRLREPEYGADHEVRRVHHSGEIRWRGYCIYISESLAKEPVGLVERDDGDWDFGPVPLGRIDRKGRFHRPKRKRRRRRCGGKRYPCRRSKVFLAGRTGGGCVAFFNYSVFTSGTGVSICSMGLRSGEPFAKISNTSPGRVAMSAE